MEFTFIDCMLVIDDMDHLNKSLKSKFSISCDVSHHEEELKWRNSVSQIRAEV